MQKKSIKDYLRFNSKERLGFFIVLMVVALILIYPFLFNNKEDQQLVITKSQDRDSANKSQDDYYKWHPENEDYQDQSHSSSPYEARQSLRESPRGHLFYFDPNTASAEEWQKLGLRDRTIKTIQNYLRKGGSFRQTEDLRKIYGLHEDEFLRLEPYIKLTSQNPNVYLNHYTGSPSQRPLYSNSFYKVKDLTIKDINTADADAFIALPGIGVSYANRIINFRDRLGGFYSVDQVSETYGLPDSTFQLIRPMLKLNRSVKQININTATKDELKVHPYIRWNIANAIVEYRNQHGSYKSLEELKNIVPIDDDVFKKISPYLTLN